MKDQSTSPKKLKMIVTGRGSNFILRPRAGAGKKVIRLTPDATSGQDMDEGNRQPRHRHQPTRLVAADVSRLKLHSRPASRGMPRKSSDLGEIDGTNARNVALRTPLCAVTLKRTPPWWLAL